MTEHGNNGVRRIAPDGTVSTVVAWNTPLRPDSLLSYPAGIAVSPSGEVYVADTQGSRIVRLVAGGGVEAVIGSSARAGFSDGAGVLARLYSPYGIAFSRTGDLIVADGENSAIRKVVIK